MSFKLCIFKALLIILLKDICFIICYSQIQIQINFMYVCTLKIPKRIKNGKKWKKYLKKFPKVEKTLPFQKDLHPS